MTKEDDKTIIWHTYLKNYWVEKYKFLLLDNPFIEECYKVLI